MRFSLDRAGFPLVAMEELNLEMSLLPITKQQFEFFLTDPDEVFDDPSFASQWYGELLELAPRACPLTFPVAERERLFITGIRRAETKRFAAWLGGFQLPSADEWRRIDKLVCNTPFPIAQLDEVIAQSPADNVPAMFGRLRGQLRSDQLAKLTLMIGGVVEWLRDPDGEFGLGQPRDAFHPNTFNPRARPFERWVLNAGERLRFAGFRLVRPLRPVPEDDQ